ncbi:MAG: processing protein [Dehalococcoidia bacterium]|nr:processing protein [Dehalococcoidia bacterium]
MVPPELGLAQTHSSRTVERGQTNAATVECGCRARPACHVVALFTLCYARMDKLVDTNEVKYWVAFSRVPGIGRARLALMEGHFGSLERAWHASAVELSEAGLDSRSVKAVLSHRPTISPQAEMERLARWEIAAFTVRDPGYPRLLKEIYDYPPVLYVKGSFLPGDERSVTVVGTRKTTAYGREVAHQLAGDLARNGVTIVSGLARGIDSIAHRAALEAGGRTIAVLANGLDTVYPPENASLAQEIVQRGALVSEYPPGTHPAAQNFPRRNRILSGLTPGTLVIEAGEVSGTLWTTSHALEQNREVMAVPGSILSPASRGANRLIQQGAKLVTSYTDVLEELNFSTLGQQMELRPLLPQDDQESHILRYITFEPVHIDNIQRAVGLPVASVSSSLAMMEIKGLVKQVGSMNYIRTREASVEYQASSR